MCGCVIRSKEKNTVALWETERGADDVILVLAHARRPLSELARRPAPAQRSARVGVAVNPVENTTPKSPSRSGQDVCSASLSVSNDSVGLFFFVCFSMSFQQISWELCHEMKTVTFSLLHVSHNGELIR